MEGLEKREAPAPLLSFLEKEDRLRREKALRVSIIMYLRHSNDTFLAQALAQASVWGVGKSCLSLKSVPGPEKLLSRRGGGLCADVPSNTTGVNGVWLSRAEPLIK